MSDVGLDLYNRLGPHKEADLNVPGYPLADLSHAAIDGLQPMEDVIRDDDIGPGWSKVLDPDRAPAVWLEWLSQFGGGRIPEGSTEQEKRNHIKDAPAFRRGGAKAIVDAVKRVQSGTKAVMLTERSGSAYQLEITVLASESPSMDILTAALLSQKPGGIKYTITQSTGGDYSIVFLTHTSYDDVMVDHPTYAHLAANPQGTP